MVLLSDGNRHMSLVRSIYRLIEKARTPSVDANLESIRENRAKRGVESNCGHGATSVAQRPTELQQDESIEEILRRDWEILKTVSAPRSEHLSETELELVLAGQSLKSDRREHYDDCRLCQDLVRQAAPTEDRVNAVSEALATPPWFDRPDSKRAGYSADYEAEELEEVVPTGSVKSRRSYAGERAVAVACLCLSVFLVVGVYNRGLYDSTAILRDRSLRQTTALKPPIAIDNIESAEPTTNIANSLIESKAKVVLSGKVALAERADADYALIKDTKRAVFIVGGKDRPAIFYLDPTTSSLRASELMNGPYEATVSGMLSYGLAKEIEIKVDNLDLGKPAVERTSVRKRTSIEAAGSSQP
jgi:hypothetical protein